MAFVISLCQIRVIFTSSVIQLRNISLKIIWSGFKKLSSSHSILTQLNVLKSPFLSFHGIESPHDTSTNEGEIAEGFCWSKLFRYLSIPNPNPLGIPSLIRTPLPYVKPSLFCPWYARDKRCRAWKDTRITSSVLTLTTLRPTYWWDSVRLKGSGRGKGYLLASNSSSLACGRGTWWR